MAWLFSSGTLPLGCKASKFAALTKYFSVLNGAFTIGTPDGITHMAEELPNPKVDLPKAVFIQVGLGTITSFFYAIAIMYGISNLDDVVTSNGSFPLAAVYSQATGKAGATFGLLLIIFLSLLICLVGTFLMLGRIWWALARDNAVGDLLEEMANNVLILVDPIPSFLLSCPSQTQLSDSRYDPCQYYLCCPRCYK